jgi:prepilin-type processing-associated H-X9-DG protein
LDNRDYIPRALDQVKWIQVFISYLGEKNRGIRDYRKVEVYQCPSFPTTGLGSNDYPNKEQTVDYVVNAWNMDDPGLSSPNEGNQQLNPTRLSSIKQPAMRVYMADNEAGDWRPVVRDEYDLDNVNNMNVLDVWSATHLPASEQETTGETGRRVAAERHRGKGCNNLFFDGHSDWLHKDENTVRYWVNKVSGGS